MIDVREVRQAIEYYNSVRSGNEQDEIDLAPIQVLERKVEDLILLMREVSNTIDEATQLWTKGKIQSVVVAAPTGSDAPANSSYTKDWWLNVIIPQITALQTHLSTASGGVKPNEVFFAKPPKVTLV
jgi:hypothetical protein